MLYREWRTTEYTVKNCVGSGIYSFRDAKREKMRLLDRRHKMLLVMAKAVARVSCFLHQFPMFPKSHGGNTNEGWWMPALQRKNTELGGVITFIGNESRPTLFQRERLPHPSRLLPVTTTLRRPGSQSLAFLESSARVLRAHGDCLSHYGLQSQWESGFLGYARISVYQSKLMTWWKIFQ